MNHNLTATKIATGYEESHFADTETLILWIENALISVEQEVRRDELKRIEKFIYDNPDSVDENKKKYDMLSACNVEHRPTPLPVSSKGTKRI